MWFSLLEHVVIVVQIVLDEAQVVEKTAVRAAEMVSKLMAVNRWCVTGTPIQRDLRGIGYWDGNDWQRELSLFFSPHSRLDP